MTKRQIIDEILTINQTAKPAFLARFGDAELDAYLSHLQVLACPRLTGDASRYEKYFVNVPKVPLKRRPWRVNTLAARAADAMVAQSEPPAVGDTPPEQIDSPRAERAREAWADVDDAEVVGEVACGMADTEDGLDYLLDRPAMAFAAIAPQAAVEDEAQPAGAAEAYDEAAAAPQASSAQPDQPAQDDAPAVASSGSIAAARASGPLFVAARQQQEAEAYLF
jgi:hypothetical protein